MESSNKSNEKLNQLQKDGEIWKSVLHNKGASLTAQLPASSIEYNESSSSMFSSILNVSRRQYDDLSNSIKMDMSVNSKTSQGEPKI